jgi:hypothetical protein
MSIIGTILTGEIVHLHVTGPNASIPVTSADLLATIQAYLRQGHVLVRADDPQLITWFENAIYPPGTAANDDFLYYHTTIFVPAENSLGHCPMAIVRKCQRLRRFLKQMPDERYRKLYEINLERRGINHWAWTGSVEEAVEDVTRDLKDLWSLRNYHVTARL